METNINSDILNESWLTGKYPNIEAEINTAYSIVSIGECFWQGHEADGVISEIHKIWIEGDCTIEKAIERWANIYLY